MAADLVDVTAREALSGVTQVIAKTENQQSVPRLDTVERMACALGVSPTWFAFGHDGDEPFVERIRRSPLQIPKDPRPGAPQPCPESYKGMPARIQVARQKAGLSLRGLADASGLSGPGVKKIEIGASVPTIDNVEAIAKALGVSPGWLAFGLGRGPDGKKTKARAVA
jgi:transcriptional regulator with XRE-family HTH domain